MKQVLLSLFILITFFNANAQSPCATDELDAYLKRTNPEYAIQQQKMNQEIYSILKNKQNNPNARITQNDCQQGVFTIPVVVHIIHKGEAIGTGTNITDAQVIDAIRGMNDQWRRLVGDGVDMEIQFALAVRDTNNIITTGITRYNGSALPNYVANGIDYNNTTLQNTVMNQTVWDRNRYINIWVAHVTGAGGWSTLGINYMLFAGYGASMGYTFAHEMGHTFGLLHTFAGDGSSLLGASTQCPANNDCLLYGDGVCDTPPHKVEDCNTTTCATNGDLQNSFKNYMSYCSSTRFTQGQKDRARIVLFRDPDLLGNFKPLIFSNALVPVSTPLEVGINKIFNHFSEPICNPFIPKISIRNSGTSTISNLKITTYVDGVQYNINNINTALVSNSVATYNLTAINFTTSGFHNLKFVITEMNGSTSDYIIQNNQECGDVLVRMNPTNNLCINLEANNFDSTLLSFSSNNPQLVNVTGCTKIGTKSLMYNNTKPIMNFHNNVDNAFYLPPFNLDSVYSAYLLFDHAYKQAATTSELYCGFWVKPQCDELSGYNISLGDNQLASVSGRDSINSWIPTDCSHWKTDSLWLSDYSGIDNMLISIRIANLNHPGNQNLYLDNFCLHKRYKINATVNPIVAGYITYTNDIDDPNIDEGVYDAGNSATIIANKNSGYQFVNWTENGVVVSTNPTYTFVVNKNRNLVANFVVTNLYDITLAARPTIGGNVSGAGQYKRDTTITVKAIPNAGYAFNGWLEDYWGGETTVSNNANYSFLVTTDRYLKADFVVGKILTLNKNYTNGGTVSGAGTYPINESVEISVTENPCYDFVNWTENGNLYSAARNTIVQMTSNRTLTANFVPKRYNITLAANPTNGGTVSGAGNFACDSLLTVKAKIKTGYKFTNWTDGTSIVSTDSNYTFLISGARSLKANFSLVTGIKQTTINEISKVYPNPANDILQIEIRSKQNTSLTLNIIDMKGSLLESKTLTNSKGTFNTSFDVSKLSKGNYILNLYDEEGMATYKFVVQ